MPAWNVEKAIEIAAPVSKVYRLVCDYRNWTRWSPWLIAEPQAKVDISEASDRVGSTYHWTGDVVGEGRLEHQRVVPDQLVEARLEFLRPQKSLCKTAFRLEPIQLDQGVAGTRLIWSIDGTLPWYLFWLKSTITTMVGMDFQRGLGMIKEFSETERITSLTEVLGVETIPSVRVAGFTARCSVDQVNASMQEMLGKVQAEYQEVGLPMEGALIAVYTKFNMSEGVFEYLLGRAIPSTLVLPEYTKLTEWSLPACRALHVRHIGSYKHLGNAWSVANRIAQHQRLKLDRRASFEIYSTVPPDTAEDALQTDLYLPLRG
jgi:effector-binding domain-containing protein/uncharacterized protein YndB with AHSA1/START domain